MKGIDFGYRFTLDFPSTEDQSFTMRGYMSKLRRIPSPPCGGFTLVEVMVAVMLLAVFIGGALGLLSSTLRTHYLVRDRTEALNLAWSRVEQASNLEFGALMDLVESDTRINRAGLPDQTGEFRRQTAITALAGELEAVLIRVEVLPLNRRTGLFTGEPEVIETVLSNILRIPLEDNG